MPLYLLQLIEKQCFMNFNYIIFEKSPRIGNRAKLIDNERLSVETEQDLRPVFPAGIWM